jgi:hypothetical protein
MNEKRRKQIAKAQALMSEACTIIGDCASEERDAFDSMPEGVQNSEKGEKSDEYATQLEEMANQLEEYANADFSE